jgi:multiple sugar transport system ATP-binding protein
MTMGHRVAVLLDGFLQQCDTPRVLYDKPANVFVAGFIGSPAMNIKTVPVDNAGAHFSGLTLPLTREQYDAAVADGGDGQVTVGFRPEDCDLVGESEGGLRVTVEIVEELGSDAYVYGSSEDGGERIVVRTDGRTTPRMADTVYIRPRVGTHHLFHAQSGVRL